MKCRILLLSVLPLLSGSVGAAAANPAKEFLRYVFGASGVKLEEICWPNPDLWMLAGPKNDAGLAEIAKLDLPATQNSILWESVDNSLCLVEIREGRADARFILDQVYLRHRQLVLSFIYHALRQDRKELAKVATNPSKVRFGRVKPASPGDLDVYEELIAGLPAVRVSQPTEDQAAKSVTYLTPLGDRGLRLRLVKRDRTWFVDTDAGVDVPLEIFFQEGKERDVVYPKR